MLTTVLLAVLIGLILLHLHLRKGRVGRLVDQFSGPPTVPIFGNILRFQLGGERLWSLTRELSTTYYPTFRIWSMGIAAVNIRHPHDVEALLTSTKNIDKSIIYEFLQPWFGTGLLTSTGHKWQSRRKMLTPAFHFNILKQFFEIFAEESERMCASLKKEGGPVVKDVLHLISEHTLNAICETAMGTSLQGRDQAFQLKYRNAVRKMGEILIYRIMRPWFYKSWMFMLSQQGKIQKLVLKILHDFTNQIIAERKTYHTETEGRYLNAFDNENAKNKQAVEDDTPTPMKKRLAMLDLLISAQAKGYPIDDIDIREEVDTFMFEGHDTTAMALTFTLALLGEHPEIQERARIEIDNALAENENKLSIPVLQQFTYLERCLKEGLRLYPSVPFISRRITQDLPLQEGKILPAGALCHLHIFDLHRDPNFWPEPNKFDPDRFLPENCQGRHPFAYIPFSAGPRNCIGQKFALMEMKAIVGLLLHNFNLETIGKVNEVRMSSDLVIRPSHPIRVKFTPIRND